MNRYILTDEVKAKYKPIVFDFILALETKNMENSTELVTKDFSGTELNPYTLCELLKDLGYSKEDQDENGWQLDFWITMTKCGCKSIHVQGTGMTFELILSEIEE